jgi:hypothetical protein
MDEKTPKELEEFANRKRFCLQYWKKAKVSQILREESMFLKPLKMAMPSLPLSRQRLHLGGFWRASWIIQ